MDFSGVECPCNSPVLLAYPNCNIMVDEEIAIDTERCGGEVENHDATGRKERAGNQMRGIGFDGTLKCPVWNERPYSRIHEFCKNTLRTSRAFEYSETCDFVHSYSLYTRIVCTPNLYTGQRKRIFYCNCLYTLYTRLLYTLYTFRVYEL